MNIVFDKGLKLDKEYLNVLKTLDSSTYEIDGDVSPDEGIVFLTPLPIDVLKYHSIFFEKYKDAPQWFFVLHNQNDHGLSILRNAARKYDLKNVQTYHTNDNFDTFKKVIEEIALAKKIVKGKTLLLSKHKKTWIADLATLIFDDKKQYEIMDFGNKADTNAENLLLCGESVSDFKGITLPENMEPYFVFNIKNEPQFYFNPKELIKNISVCYHITTERVESRLYFVDIESEKWLSSDNKAVGDDALANGILLLNRFGLPLSRSEYTKANIESIARKYHENIAQLKQLI